MIFIRDIQRTVADHYGIPVEKMREPAYSGAEKNRFGVSRPRQVAMCLARRYTKHSYHRIGHYFGGRDHSTVLHAVRMAPVREPEALQKLAEAVKQEAGR